MSRPSVLLLLGLPLFACVGTFWACSSGPGEAALAPDAAANDGAPLLPDGSSIPCTPTDIAPGTGKKFCDLPGTDATEITVPPEFCAREFTTMPVVEARVLRFAPNGDLFVAAPSMLTAGGQSDGLGAIVVLPDDNADGRADSIVTFAGPSPRNGNALCNQLEGDPANLACVHGLVFADGYLYFTRSDEVRRFPYVAGARAAAGPSELVAPLGGGVLTDMRWTHTLERAKDGSLYVSRGRLDSSLCSPEEMTKGAVFTLAVAGGTALPVKPELMADGFRNPMYLRCAPNSCGECYASELNGDGWDSVGGREKIALLGRKNESWGYPCCVERGKVAPGAMADNCGSVGREVVAIPLHDTPFGLDFDRGAFPAPYTHGLFVALHGIITSFGGTGVLWLKTDPVTLRPLGEPTLFVKGFRPSGRATDVAFAPDGRMFIADDTSGKIFWVAPRTLAAPR